MVESIEVVLSSDWIPTATYDNGQGYYTYALQPNI